MQRDATRRREAWVDYAKGICIVLVVMLHSTLGIEAAAGQESWMHYLVAFAKPFRMPDFFLVAGLFLARRIDRDWSDYLDRKVYHFAYFYLLWLTVQFLVKAPLFVSDIGVAGTLYSYLEGLVQPFGTLWFIYLLPFFFVVTKALKDVSPLAVWCVAAVLEFAVPHTGVTVVDNFCDRFVYFYTGYILAPHVFDFAASVGTRQKTAFACLAGWAVLNGYYVFAGLAELPLISLTLGYMGVAAVITVAVLLTRLDWGRALRYCGEHSLVIYLAFPIPMGITRIALMKLGFVSDLGLLSLLVTGAGLCGALILYWIVNGTRFAFLFERPDWARVSATVRTRWSGFNG